MFDYSIAINMRNTPISSYTNLHPMACSLAATLFGGKDGGSAGEVGKEGGTGPHHWQVYNTNEMF